MGHVFFYSALKVIGAVKIILKTQPKTVFRQYLWFYSIFLHEIKWKKFITKSNKII